MTLRTFNTVEEAVETWEKESEAKQVKSGILCTCACYRGAPGERSLFETCQLLLPEKIYNQYQRYRPDSDAAVLGPGVIRVNLSPNERENYVITQDLCKYRFTITAILQKHLGQKIRLGKNIRA